MNLMNPRPFCILLRVDPDAMILTSDRIERFKSLKAKKQM